MGAWVSELEIQRSLPAQADDRRRCALRGGARPKASSRPDAVFKPFEILEITEWPVETVQRAKSRIGFSVFPLFLGRVIADVESERRIPG
jgi:hypothetical protein